ncbi:hypothetical protein TorRG33x02_200870 [Trema orientale]|uniref:Uncharacterized protein n=1 Tax=Trema orientale TaxID=63057 RepID=A0A2P5EEV2_TREOI|nr:hypothetical protein TorRG33x02_200870 [Trema orientale]
MYELKGSPGSVARRSRPEVLDEAIARVKGTKLLRCPVDKIARVTFSNLAHSGAKMKYALKQKRLHSPGKDKGKAILDEVAEKAFCKRKLSSTELGLLKDARKVAKTSRKTPSDTPLLRYQQGISVSLEESFSEKDW